MPPPLNAIGLDIGGRTIQLVALSADKVSPQLVAALTLELDPDRPYTREELAEKISALFHAARVRGPTLLAIGGNVATVQMLTFPRSAQAQLRRMVDIEVQRLAGLSPEEMVHDFLIVPTGRELDQKVLVGLCRVPALNEQLALVSNAGIEAEDITISTIALFNGFQFTGATEKDKVTAFLELGRDATNLAIESDGALHFVRTFTAGSNSFTMAVADSEQLGYGEAERWKIEQGSVPESELTTGQFARRQASLFHAAEGWLKELNTNLAYFSTARGATVTNVDRFVLCGGGAQLRGLAKFLEARLGKPVTLGAPLQTFRTIPKVANLPEDITVAEAGDPRFAPALGLALQGLGLAAQPLSLLPAEVRAARISPEEGRKWVLAGALAVSIGLCATLWAITDFFLQRKRLADRQESAKTGKALSQQIDEEKKRNQIGTGMIGPFLYTGSRRDVYVETLRALSQNKPPDAWVSLVADAESYFGRKVDSLGVSSSSKVPEISVTTLAARGRGTNVPPLLLTTMIVEGYTERADMKNVEEFRQRLEAHQIGGKSFFKRVDALPIDLRSADPVKDEMWAQYQMHRFTLRLTLTEADATAPSKSTIVAAPTSAPVSPATTQSTPLQKPTREEFKNFVEGN